MELLAPVGNLDTFYVAVSCGANAVYLGLKNFSARRGADNFSYDELVDVVKYAHVMGVKVYVALNTLVKESELESFFKTVLEVRRANVDAVILQDLFLGKYISARLPDLELHFSTQGGVNNVDGATVAKQCGFSRVILARETPLKEIKKIASFIDTEVFVQGALCTSFSGHCYMSSFGGGNSGNRGLCKQPCRRKYTLNGEESYAICTADLSVGERIVELKEAGIKSFKIEGRMRRAEYVSAALNYYRSILYPNENVGNELSALKRTFNRGNYTQGLAYGQKKDFISKKVQGHIGERVGVVKAVKGNNIYVNGNLNPRKGDGYKILRNGEEVGNAEYRGERATGTVPLVYKGDVKPSDEVFVTTDTALNEILTNVTSARILNVSFTAREGACPIVKVYADGDLVASVEGQTPLERARGRALSLADLKEAFDKVDTYPFAVEQIEVDIDGELFMPKSALNALRRVAYERTFESLSYREKPTEAKLEIEAKKDLVRTNAKIAVIAENFKGLRGYDIAIFAPCDYNDERFFFKFMNETEEAEERYLYLPSLLSEEDIAIIQKRIEGFDGLYGENPHLFELAKRFNVKAFVGTDFNVFNSIAFSQACERATHVAFSKELTEKEIKSTSYGDFGFVFTRGDVKVMELGYCPYGKNCRNCSAPTLNTLTDYAGRKFTLRRVKLSKCYFEVYNPVELVYEDSRLSIYNFVLRRGDELLQRFNCTVKEYRERYATTSGHLKNPIE